MEARALDTNATIYEGSEVGKVGGCWHRSRRARKPWGKPEGYLDVTTCCSNLKDLLFRRL